MSQAFHVVRKDLVVIFIVVIVIGVSFGVLAYMDAQYHTIATWSEQFYRLILRQ